MLSREVVTRNQLSLQEAIVRIEGLSSINAHPVMVVEGESWVVLGSVKRSELLEVVGALEAEGIGVRQGDAYDLEASSKEGVPVRCRDTDRTGIYIRQSHFPLRIS